MAVSTQKGGGFGKIHDQQANAVVLRGFWHDHLAWYLVDRFQCCSLAALRSGGVFRNCGDHGYMPGFDRFKNVDEERMRVGFSNEPGPDSGVKLSFQRNQNTPALFGASLWHGGPTFASVSGAAGQGR